MALIDISCEDGHIAENFYRAAKDWQTTPPCETCGKPTERIFLPPRTAHTVDPVIVYQAPDGSLRFPGAKEGLSNARYEQQGFRRIEIRGALEMRRFEKHMNQHERSIMSRKLEARQRADEERERVNRRELRSAMSSMTRRGRDLARVAMSRNDNKPKKYSSDPGFFNDAYSNDRSSRDEHRGSDGRRGRD
jgi:hypothetical protein